MVHYTTSVAVLLVGALPLATLARECRTNGTSPEGYFPRMDLTSPSQLAQFSECDTLTGYIHVSPDFKGTLELPASVTNFSGYITRNYGQPTDGLDGVILPNVRSMESIELYGAYGVKSVSAPRLETLGRLLVEQAVEEGASLDFGALREVETIALAGYWSSISFPSLQEITFSMSVHTDPSREATDVLVPVDIDLPVLKEAGQLSLYGQIKSLSTPLVEVLGRGNQHYYTLTLRANYTAMEGVFLPALQELYGEFRVNGSVSAVDLGGMKNASAPIKIDVETPIEIYSGLENAGRIFVRGPLAVINFTNLTTAADLNITTTSSTPLSCPRALVDIYRYFSDPDEPAFCNAESLSAAGENPYLNPDYMPSYPVTGYATVTSDSASTSTWGYGSGSTPTPWWSPTPTPIYSPTPTPGGGGGKLSSGAEAAIATVAVVVGLVGIGGWVLARRRNRRAKSGGTGADSNAPGAGGSELGAVAAAGAGYTATTSRRGDAGEEEERLPRHSADVAPPPYSREEPRKA
ncbi:hypothetical protein ASPCAL11342 [Aspergillus calidoustus]|uniref:GPI anchored protein n=1 Tax=Aspergillus calidoustus TaxID=454130 RepID=A0A0U5GC03_ASPCI|nr:hypothetical protein ASPCAL11342 [Aspergillus calidoustus]